MNEQRASRSDTNGYGRCLAWILEPLRQLLSARPTHGRRLTPMSAGPQSIGHGTIVQHTRAGDVYRL